MSEDRLAPSPGSGWEPKNMHEVAAADRVKAARDAYWEAHAGPIRTALIVDALSFGVTWADQNPDQQEDDT